MSEIIQGTTLPRAGQVERRYYRFGMHNTRMAFRRWRRSRPFWGGFWSILGGLMIAYGPTTAFRMILIAGSSVWLGIVVGVLIVLFGLVLWFAPAERKVASLLIVVLSVASFITSDLGGFLIGMIMGMVGGSMGFAWVPIDPEKIKPHFWRRTAKRQWKERRRLERRMRKMRRSGAIEVTGAPAEPAIAVPGIPIEAPVAEPLISAAVPAESAPPSGDAIIETTGEEVDRLPVEEAAARATDAKPASRRSRRPFGHRR